MRNKKLLSEVTWMKQPWIVGHVSRGSKYKMTPELTAVTKLEEGTRMMVLQRIWLYIKVKELHMSYNNAIFIPDAKLGKILGGRDRNFSRIK